MAKSVTKTKKTTSKAKDSEKSSAKKEEDKKPASGGDQLDITKLKELERLKTEFVSNVSHELRTPLTNIKTFITLLQRGRPEKRERYFNVLEQETERLTHLIQDLLDLSRLETGVTKINLALQDLAPILHRCALSFEQQAAAENIRLINKFPETLPEVWADEEQ